MMAVKLEKKLLRTIANRKMLGKDREFCLSFLYEKIKITPVFMAPLLSLWC